MKYHKGFHEKEALDSRFMQKIYIWLNSPEIHMQCNKMST